MCGSDKGVIKSLELPFNHYSKDPIQVMLCSRCIRKEVTSIMDAMEQFIEEEDDEDYQTVEYVSDTDPDKSN